MSKPFTKGHKKLGGRVAGTLNKDTSQIRKYFSEILNNNIEKIQEDLDSLEPKERLNIIVKLAEFVLPKLTSISGALVTEPQQIIISDNTEYGLP